ncbi:MAG: hypothetical protein LBG05_09395 [Treponema sp.]|nr:hypothetical protein [Treponema sp.]
MMQFQIFWRLPFWRPSRDWALRAERTAERAICERLESLDDYASKISWLLNFLYNRYVKFSDLEMEVNGGLKGIAENASIGEAGDRYKDLKRL